MKIKKEEFGIFLGLCGMLGAAIGFAVGIFWIRKLGVGIFFLSWLVFVVGMFINSNIRKNKK